MQRLEVNGAVRPIYGSLGVKMLNPVAAVQYTFTHKQYTEQHNETEYNT